MERTSPAHIHWTRVDITESTQLDPDSFATLFERARGTLRLVAASECGFDLADDIVQHSAIIALSKLDQFTPGTNFSAWTATIVRGVARNQRRSEQRRIARTFKVFSRTPKHQHTRTMHKPQTTPRANPIGPGFDAPFELDIKIKDALNTLKANQRACLLLRTVLDHSYSEIGEILDMPAATARSHVFRARTLLLDLLQSESIPTTDQITDPTTERSNS
jgi:RNA polymerase sigma-70 factor, ECF subfamily